MKLLVYWRTAIVVLLLGLMLLAALQLCRLSPTMGVDLFGKAAWALVALAGIAAGKSAIEHLGNGGGIFGMLKVLGTAAKPDTPPGPGAQP